MRSCLLRSALVVSVLLVGVLPGTAFADSHSSGWVDQDDGEIEVGAEGGKQGEGADVDGASSQPVCDWEQVPEDSIAYQRWASNEESFTLYYVDCPDEPRDIVEVPADPGGQAASVVGVRERAVELLALPTPQIELNPADPVVHVETWLWLDGFVWEAVSETASAGGVTAMVTARPHRVVWDMGNGDQVECDGPGTAYDTNRTAEEQHTDCAYVYLHTSAGQPGEVFRVTATVTWELTWTVAGAAGGGALPVATTSGSVDVQVSEMQALNR